MSDNNVNPSQGNGGQPQDPNQGGQTPPVPPGQPPVPPVPPAPPHQPPAASDGVSGGPATPPPVPGQPVPPPPAPGYAPAPVPVAVPQTNQNATISLVLAIASWLVCPIVLAIIALVLASKADKEIKASNGWQTGSGLVTASKIISWIHIALAILGIIVVAIVLIVVAANPDLQRQIVESPHWTDPNTWPSTSPSALNG